MSPNNASLVMVWWCLRAFLLVMAVCRSVAFQPRQNLCKSHYPVSTVSPPAAARIHKPQQRQRRLEPLNVVTDRESDLIEMMMGGERFEMVPLPDRMCETTLFVGNLCEFVHDEDLSQLFQTVSVLQSVPSCVIRKANMQSLRYGFVSFPTVAEKEAAILRFHGSEWRGKDIKVEPIQDDPKRGRVRVPERMVTYVSGSLKKTRNGRVNSMRNAGDGDNEGMRKKKKKQKMNSNKKKKTGLLPKAQRSASASSSRLSNVDRQELLRACKKGFLTLDGRSAGHGSLASLCSSVSLKESRLAVAHREWCDEREKPNIILYKASGRQSRELLDHIVVDLSPLRDLVLDKWRSEILDAALPTGMILQSTEGTEECEAEYNSHGSDELSSVYSDSVGSRQPIAKLPFVSMGFFVGERSNAKSMAKELALLWDLPEIEEKMEAAEDQGKMNSHKGGRYQNNHGRAGKVISKAKDERRAKRRKVRRDDWEQSLGKFMRY